MKKMKENRENIEKPNAKKVTLILIFLFIIKILISFFATIPLINVIGFSFIGYLRKRV